MKITLAAVGKLKEKFLIDAMAEYLKRLRPYVRLEIREVPECRTIAEEGQKLLAQVPKDAFKFVLDVAGVEITSENLAKKIAALSLHGKSDIVFIIGGAFGLSEEVRQAADFRLSLSQMTFTHQMARLILTEQIYRAFKINRGEPYHY